MLQAQHMEDKRAQGLFNISEWDRHITSASREVGSTKHGGAPALESLPFIIHPSAFSGELDTSPFIPTWLLFTGAMERLLLLRRHTEHNV